MKHKILVVEDDPLLRMLAVDLVEDAGFEAVEAGNADEAVQLLTTIPDIRILFTDIDMPGSMDGLKLAAVVRDGWPPVEIIIVSGMTLPSPSSLPARGIFFSKPYDTRAVTRALVAMVG
jgi:CheY-like chemotaxis protein